MENEIKCPVCGKLITRGFGSGVFVCMNQSCDIAYVGLPKSVIDKLAERNKFKAAVQMGIDSILKIREGYTAQINPFNLNNFIDSTLKAMSEAIKD